MDPHVLLFQYNEIDIGYCTRTSPCGPESEIVFYFLQFIRNKYELQNGTYAIFIEPKLDTGFPDIVVVKYSQEYYKKHWNSRRLLLTTRDLKLLNFLYSTQGVSFKDIIFMLGIQEKKLQQSIEKLLSAEMITCTNQKRYRPKPLKYNWGIQYILSIEAKIKNWQSAIEQAENNIWFTSESYVLFPSRRISTQILNRITSKNLELIN